MAIGINWKEVWKPVWKAVWRQEVIEPPVEAGGGYPGRPGVIHLPETYYKSTDDDDILSFVISWTLKQ